MAMLNVPDIYFYLNCQLSIVVTDKSCCRFMRNSDDDVSRNPWCCYSWLAFWIQIFCVNGFPSVCPLFMFIWSLMIFGYEN